MTAHITSRSQTWIPPPKVRYKWNTNVSRLECTKTTTNVCKDSSGELLRISRHSIGNCPTLMFETLATREGIWTAIRIKVRNIIVESDFLICIRFINGQTEAPTQVNP